MINKIKLSMGVLAILGCLLAASSLHTHEAGLYDIAHTCISCDIEDMSAHGALPATAVITPPRIGFVKTEPVKAYVGIISDPRPQIRAPPSNS